MANVTPEMKAAAEQMTRNYLEAFRRVVREIRAGAVGDEGDELARRVWELVRDQLVRFGFTPVQAANHARMLMHTAVRGETGREVYAPEDLKEIARMARV